MENEKSGREGVDRLGYGEESTERARDTAAREKAERERRASEIDEAGFLHELPDSYGTDRVVALVRDPYWIHAYWELTEQTFSLAMRRLRRAARGTRVVLRVYSDRGAGTEPEHVLFDIPLTLEARNWYINVASPASTYRVDLGLLTLDGKFLRLVRSNTVTTPRDRMAEELDEEWRSISSKYEEMYVLSGGLDRGVGSFELHKRLARRLELEISSPLFSPGYFGRSGDPGPRGTR